MAEDYSVGESPLEEEFRYTLLQIGTGLTSKNCHGLRFVHKINGTEQEQGEPGLNILRELIARGHFDALYPDKLQVILGKIGRKDLGNLVKEYKKSSIYKQAEKQEKEKEAEEKRKQAEEKKKSKKRFKPGRGEGSSERYAAAELLHEVPQSIPPEERRCRDMFSIALTHTAQLIEQTNLLRESIKLAMDEAEDNSRKEEALVSIAEAQEGVENLSKSLVKAISATGLTQRKRSEENLLGSHPTEETHKKKKKAMLPLHLQTRERASSPDEISEQSATLSSFPSSRYTPTLSRKPVHYKAKPSRLESPEEDSTTSSISHSKTSNSKVSTPEMSSSGEESPSQRYAVEETQEDRHTNELKEAVTKLEKRPSTASSIFEDSGYVDTTWDMSHLPNLPGAPLKKEVRPYINVPLKSVEEYAELKEETKDKPQGYTDVRHEPITITGMDT